MDGLTHINITKCLTSLRNCHKKLVRMYQTHKSNSKEEPSIFKEVKEELLNKCPLLEYITSAKLASILLKKGYLCQKSLPTRIPMVIVISHLANVRPVYLHK